MDNIQSGDISNSISNVSKLQKLQALAQGSPVPSTDTAALKSRIATFMIAHADKVMDAVAPLECLRDELVQKFSEMVQDSLEDPELTIGTVSRAIDAVQTMNTYSLSTLRGILEQEKLTTYIAIDASDRSTVVNNNVLNLDNPQSRQKVIKAVDAILKLAQASEGGLHTDDSQNN